ncbi:MAG: murein biosynthesis integral membrane protein MurJ [Phycisphaerae bacterium]|nr:murein biosynthesis integral membrane protein MurJ [Phycisphaerae bacterium]
MQAQIVTTSNQAEPITPDLLQEARRNWRMLFLVLFILLTVGTHLPNANLGGVGGTMPDKLFHFFGFGLLTLSLWRARLLPLAWMAPVTVAIWLPIDEWTQGLAGPGRTVATNDMVAGWMGVGSATSFILLLSVWGPVPVQVARRRFLLILDLISSNGRNAVGLILMPSLTCIGLFLLLNFVLNSDASDPRQQYWWSEILFVVSAGIGLTVGLVQLNSKIRTATLQIEEHHPCLDCGRTLDPSMLKETGQASCPDCGQSVFATQWEQPWERLIQTRRRFSVFSAATALACFASAFTVTLILLDKLSQLDFFYLQNTTILLSTSIAICGGGFAYWSLAGREAINHGWSCRRCNRDLSDDPDQAGSRRCPDCDALNINWQDHAESSPRNFERHARTVMSMTAISRLTGLVREGVLSRIFGTDAMLSSFFFAFLVPNLFRRLFGEGALSAAFLPIYEKLNREDPEIARRLASATLGTVLAIVGSVVLIAELALFLINMTFEESNTAIWLLMLMLPYAPLVCLVAILGAMLQVHGRFGPTAAAPIVLNICIIGAATLGVYQVDDFNMASTSTKTVFLMSIFVVLAGLIQVVWSWMALSSYQKLPISIRGAGSSLKEVFRKAGPMILGLGVLQVNTLIDGLIASYRNYTGCSDFLGTTWPLDEQAMAVLTFGQRLYQFPLGVFGIAVATAIYPLLSRLADDRSAFSSTVHRGIRLVLFIGIPASLGLMVVASPLTATILQGGLFNMDDTQRVAFVLLGYASCVWAYSLIQVMTRAFYAVGDTMTPVKIAVSVVGLNLVLNLVLIWTPLKEAGLAWSTAICATLQAGILLRLLRRHVDVPLNKDTIRSIMQTVLLTILMVALLTALQLVLPEGEGWFIQVRNLAALVVAGTLIVGGGSRLLRMPELRWAMGGRASS